ncbi:probable LRR receptor-like serine/threonine-protein kinase At3g47570 isoform X2 [Sorghum bicolor]|uniref:probable LRR receptor-like serine/threonine-protein kinase At3g47570 isoform X2 n=1 Tax=Sorghum bicolor TaxID=4558 RepID=UPI000B426563|nr:probable LRR receptor-like serine/threonine-protein kinase At3g47570 isoform X2 [Sorghum bicolor]|eukprot:XP_021319815.1 probable LRR receptor-like serine/threonine-protein kinase At3g47570 isoform X2 [Sorghum bicolor]
MCSIVSLLYCLLILLSINITVVTSAEANKTEIDRQALLCFKSGISSDPLGVLNSWRNTSRNFCNWSAVTCDIHLADNSLSGAIPDELGMLPGLQTLMLAGNHLEGNIPDSLGSSMSLSYVNLANNSLTGSIPHSLASSSSLSTLILSRNSLTGEIPANLFYNSSALTTVDLQMNSFTGVIPPFDKVTALKNLCVTENFLSGGIPPSIGNISSLRFVLLGQNLLTGSVPESLGHISELFELDLSFNSLSGYVPMPLYNLSSLKYISLGSNRLVGQLPSYIGYSLPSLQVLIMQSNNLEGLIPASLENASNLQVLDLSNNSLYGRIPSLGSLAKLRQVLLGRNQLEVYDWQFLVSLTNCAQLKKLSLEGNMMNGSLPGSIGNLSTSLEYLLLGSNQISGSIPVEISNLVNLTMLSMENNFLSGSIPDKIGKLRNLFILNLSKNKLSGQIPSTVGNIAQLNQLYLDDNMLSGHIPASLGQCTRLAMLNLSVNNLDGSIPSEIFSISSLSLGLDLSNNNLTGTIPVGIGKLINLGLLNISSNKLSGQIPDDLGQCALLLSLQMEGNTLSGFIPRSLIELKAIQLMDLSENNLSGNIPDFFKDFKTLYYLNLSYNKLEGPIPTGGFFQNSSVVFLGGNKGLCSRSSTLALPVCDGAGATEPKKHGVPLLVVVIPSVTIALLLLLWFLVTLWKKRVFEFPSWEDILRMVCLVAETERREVKTFPHSNETLKKVSYSDILRATNCFSSVHTISSTRTGSVYVGRFKYDKSLVAIKVFNLNEPAAYESYFIECEVLRSTRHRNLMRPVTLCSTLDTGNHEFKALIFKFMVNGSLETWLHSEHYSGLPERVLSLGQRIHIAADVASALDYVHNQVSPPLVHCDLKPSNILLDKDMTARLSDFGSAKFLFPGLSVPKSLAEVGGTIGYMAPEYAMGSEIATEGDVYSFGVLLLEIVTGKHPTDDLFVDGLNLHNFAESMFPDRLAEIIDPHMAHEESQPCTEVWMQSCIVPLVALGLSCSMESPKDRPRMQDVCAKLFAIEDDFQKSHGQLLNSPCP